MKFVLFLTFLIVFSSFMARRVKVHSKRFRHRHRGPVANTSLVYQFLLGLITELDGENAWLDQCSQKIPGLEGAATQKEESEKKVDNDLKQQQTFLQKALPYLGKAVDFLCGYKDDIVTYLVSKLKRYIRLFLQGKTRRRTFAWDASALWESVKVKAKAFGQKVLDGTANIGSTVIGTINFVCKTIQDIENFMKDQVAKLLKPLVDVFEQIKQKFFEFLNSNPVIKAAYDFFECLNTNQEAIKKTAFLEPLKGFKNRISKLNTAEGWVKFVVDAICAWSDLADALEFLKNGVEATDGKVKYNLYGKFFGKLIQTLQLPEEEAKAKY